MPLDNKGNLSNADFKHGHAEVKDDMIFGVACVIPGDRKLRVSWHRECESSHDMAQKEAT
jgi:hypothetical protein